MTRLTAQQLRGAAASTFISAGFAFAWGLSGSFALPGGWSTLALVVAILLTLALTAAAFTFSRSASRFPSETDASHPNPFRTPSYRAAVIAMFLAFPIAGRLLSSSGHPGAIMPVIAIIVGLHFIGLVRAFRNSTFGWVAGAFCFVGGVALLLPVQLGAVALRQAVVGLGCALVLWVSVSPLVLRTLRQWSRAERDGLEEV